MMLYQTIANLVAAAAMMTTNLPCNIPVFRYALERWPSDDYQVVVYYRGLLSTKDQSQLQRLELLANPPAKPNGIKSIKNLNLRLIRVDLDVQPDKDDTELRALHDRWNAEHQLNGHKLPLAEIRSSAIARQQLTVWQGSLNELGSMKLDQSPICEQLARKLLKGDAVVWLLIKSSLEEKNQELLKILHDKNKSLSQEMELPDGIGLPGSELYSEVPLLLEFTSLEVARNDPQELMMLNLFRAMEPEAFERDEPLLVPVFGRGRALEVIPASRVDAGLINDLTAFLCGACSCQVKERNPGFDLLMSVDWQQKLFGDGPLPPAPDTGLGTQKSGPTLRQIPSGKNR